MFAKQLWKSNSKESGFTFVETIISLAIVGIVVVGASGALKLNSKNAVKIEHSTKFKDFEATVASLLLKRTNQILKTAAATTNSCESYTLPTFATWYGNSSTGYNYPNPAVNISLLESPSKFDEFPDTLKRRCLRISVNSDGEEGSADPLPNINLCNFNRFYSCYEISAINPAPDSFFSKNRAIVELRFDLKNTEQNTDATFRQFGGQTNKAFNMYYSMHWARKGDETGSSTSRSSAMLAGYVLNDMSAADETSDPEDNRRTCIDSAFHGGVQDPRHYCLFVSKFGYTGSLRGLEGADEKCTHLAAEGGLLDSRVQWKAILSASGHHARDRIKTDKNVYVNRMLNGVFTGDLFATPGNFWTNHVNQPIYNQFGYYYDYREPGTYHGNHTWTATTGSNGYHTGINCYNWTKRYGHGHVGDSSNKYGDDDVWFDGSKATQPCGKKQQIYCISQPLDDPEA